MDSCKCVCLIVIVSMILYITFAIFNKRHDDAQKGKVSGGAWPVDIKKCKGVDAIIWYNRNGKKGLKHGVASLRRDWYVFGDDTSSEFYHANIGQEYAAADKDTRGCRCFVFLSKDLIEIADRNITTGSPAFVDQETGQLYEDFRATDTIVTDAEGKMYFQRTNRDGVAVMFPLYAGSAGVCEVVLRCLTMHVLKEGGVETSDIKYGSDKTAQHVKGQFTGVWPSPGAGTGEMFEITLHDNEAYIDGLIDAAIKYFEKISTHYDAKSFREITTAEATARWLRDENVYKCMSNALYKACTAIAGDCT